MLRYFLIIFLFIFPNISGAQNNTIWLRDLDLSKVQQGWSTVHVNTNLLNEPLSINKVRFENGICTHAYSEIEILLNMEGKRFTALVGVDDHVSKGTYASIYFIVLGDKDTLFRSPIMGVNQQALPIDVSLVGYKKLTLITHDAFDGSNQDHGNWVNAAISYTGSQKPHAYYHQAEALYLQTPPVSDFPKINGAQVSAARPGSPYLFRVPITGKQPMKIQVCGLPKGLAFDPKTNIISGVVAEAGTYKVRMKASNSKGKVISKHSIVIGDKLALTPPMGWNSWNAWGMAVSEEKVRDAIDAFQKFGLANHGWTYINIDDGWQADQRNADSTLQWNAKFNDMKLLADYAHSKGLKLGIYSSPGAFTCGHKIGSLNYERKDAKTWESWGIDFLKYDWCTYSNVIPEKTRVEYMKPYVQISNELKSMHRDIVLGICQYGLDNVWEWGSQAGGSTWRTTNDIIDTWHSMKAIGFERQNATYPYAAPGAWNDPDMLVLGKLGWGANLRSSRLTCNEQYTHFTQWAMLAAPLMLGCDLAQLDSFTLNLITNDEVIAINQDIMGKQAQLMYTTGDVQVWKKELSCKRFALAVYNLGREESNFEVNFKMAGLKSKLHLRDAWTQKNIGKLTDNFKVLIPRHGCKLYIVK